MLKSCGVVIVAAALALAGCNREDSDHKSASREAGRAAYELSQKTKRAAENAERDLRKAGQNAREGWNEARREDHAKRKTPEPERRRN